MFNAAALPGGYIVVFKPAITETNGDALASIIAHEVAHVRRRHVTEALLRELGIGALIRMFAGNRRQCRAAGGTQLHSAERGRSGRRRDRDAEARRHFAQAHRRAVPAESPQFSAQFLQSHPQSAKRADRFATSFDPIATYRPALDRASADALFNICWNAPSSK
jgi:Zn-dependent protease with chaperone function